MTRLRLWLLVLSIIVVSLGFYRGWFSVSGDMEAEMVQRYLEAVEGGLIVFAAVVEPEAANHAATTAKGRGASEVVHFGDWVITNY